MGFKNKTNKSKFKINYSHQRQISFLKKKKNLKLIHNKTKNHMKLKPNSKTKRVEILLKQMRGNKAY